MIDVGNDQFCTQTLLHLPTIMRDAHELPGMLVVVGG